MKFFSRSSLIILQSFLERSIIPLRQLSPLPVQQSGHQVETTDLFMNSAMNFFESHTSCLETSIFFTFIDGKI